MVRTGSGSKHEDLLQKISAHVSGLLEANLPSWAVYHGLNHTLETVEYSKEIADALQFNEEDLTVLLVAAWFHDVGYIDGAEEHEEKSKQLAREFLIDAGCTGDFCDRVVSAIQATQVPQRPKDIVEGALCDADVMHLGKKSFFSKSALLRSEMEGRQKVQYTDEEWYLYNISFVA
jgi:predicted metal-dependent HD superfamily phosphohydrolase